MPPLSKRILHHRDFFYRISSLAPDDFLDELIPRYQMYYRRLKLLKTGSQFISFEDIASGGLRRDTLKTIKETRKMLIEAFLMFFLYQECKLTQNCLAKLFKCWHRSTVRRRLRIVIGIQYLISTRSAPSKQKQEERNAEELINKLVGDFPASEKRFITVLRARRTAAEHRTIRTPEEFFALYPQLAESRRDEIPTSNPSRKSSRDVRQQRINTAKVQSKTLPPPPPALTPQSYKNSGTALKYLTEKRWNGQIRCAFCEAEKIYALKVKTAPKGAVTGSAMYKCARCRRKFTVITGTRLSGCRLKPEQILKAVFYIAVRPRREEYTLEKFASEVGITAKTAAHFVNLLRQNSTIRGKMPEILRHPAKNIPISPERKTRISFLKIRTSIPDNVDKIIETLLEPVAGIHPSNNTNRAVTGAV